MKILMVCSEFAPWAKTGGLADAVAGLSDALSAGGHDVRVLLPRYAHLPAPRGSRHTVEGRGGPFVLIEIEPEQSAGDAGRRRGRPRIFLLELGELTADAVYTGDARDLGRFLHLSAAAVALSAGDWRPDVIHCHDWHTALTPILQRLEPRSSAANVLTLHNVGYQGVFADTALREQGFASVEQVLPADARSGGYTNFLRAGIGAADRVTTVSPTYAEEIRQPAFGMGLEDVLSARGADLIGILNGVDYGVWSPDRDPFLPLHYHANRQFLRFNVLDCARSALHGGILDQPGSERLAPRFRRIQTPRHQRTHDGSRFRRHQRLPFLSGARRIKMRRLTSEAFSAHPGSVALSGLDKFLPVKSAGSRP
jgi:starch synthase